MKVKFFILLTIIINLTTFGQSNIKISEKAPPISVSDWIANIPKDKILTNKFIVLEFWATWCGPCIAAVPHMDSLQSKFKEPNIYFISITDESKEKVERILKRIPFNSIVVSDQSKQTQVLFGDGKKGLEAFPLTVLIDKKGIVCWIGDPQELTESIMNEFLKGKEITISEVNAKMSNKENLISSGEVVKDDILELISNNDILYKFEFRKSKGGNTSISSGRGNFVGYKSIGLLELLSNLFGQPKNNISVPENLKNQKFDLLYRNYYGGDENLLEIESRILKILRLEKALLKRNLPVHEVSNKNLKLLEKALDEDFSSKSEADTKIIFTNYLINDLIKELNFYSDERFSIGNTVEGKYDFIIEISNVESIKKSLESYGFIISNTEKEIEMWNYSPGK